MLLAADGLISVSMSISSAEDFPFFGGLDFVSGDCEMRCALLFDVGGFSW